MLDPQARALTENPAPAPAEIGLRAYRQAARDLVPLAGEPEPVASVTDEALRGVRVRRYVPADARGLLVYLHGGGWIQGDIDTHDPLCRALANRAGCEVVAISYALAPERPFPAGLEEAWQVVRVLGEDASVPVAVGGDSSGGALAARLAQRARDAGGPELVLQLLLCPALDLRLTSPSLGELGGGGYVLTTETLRWCRDAYLAGHEAGDPEASPALEPRLEGLAPAFVLAAEYDPLRDDGEVYAARLHEAGVQVEYTQWPGQLHAFFLTVGIVDAGRAAIDAAAAALRDAFALE